MARNEWNCSSNNDDRSICFADSTFQLVSTARLAVPHAKTAWFWETKVLYIDFGGLIAYLLHRLSVGDFSGKIPKSNKLNT